MKRRDRKIRTEQDTEKSISEAKERLLLERAEFANSTKDEQIAALYYESVAQKHKKV